MSTTRCPVSRLAVLNNTAFSLVHNGPYAKKGKEEKERKGQREKERREKDSEESLCLWLGRKGQRGKDGLERTARKRRKGQRGEDGEERTARKGRNGYLGKDSEERPTSIQGARVARTTRMASKIFLDVC